MIIKIFQKEGFEIIKSTFFNPELLLKKGNHTKIKPNKINKKDMFKGKRIITDLKNKSCGQGIVVKNGHIISIEGPDGTDAMLNRANNLINKFYFQGKKDGILLKFPKKTTKFNCKY